MGKFVYNDPSKKNLRRTLRKTQTEAERKLWNIVRGKKFGFRFFRQYSIGPYILDLFCPARRFAVEIDGGQHSERINQAYDKERADFLADRNIEVIRFWNNEVLEHAEGVIEEIQKHLTPPSLPL